MSEVENTNGEIGAGLSGVPGLGPVRRRLLAEAGIATHADLATASVEQLISVTGMPRSAAEQALASVASFAVPEAVIKEANDSADVVLAEDAEADEPLGEETPQATRLEYAVFRAQTAISDASRMVQPGSRLNALLLRFVRFTDALPMLVQPEVRPRVQKKIAERIEAMNEHLETLAKKSGGKKEPRPLGPKRAERLEARLKRTRDAVKALIKSAQAKSKKSERASPSGS